MDQLREHPQRRERLKVRPIYGSQISLATMPGRRGWLFVIPNPNHAMHNGKPSAKHPGSRRLASSKSRRLLPVGEPQQPAIVSFDENDAKD
jgi:hypothetical protein